MFVFFLILAIVFAVLWRKEKKSKEKAAAEHDAFRENATESLNRLSKYQSIVDAEAEADRIRKTAADEAASVKESAMAEAKATRERAAAAKAKADEKLSVVEREAASIISAANEKAALIAGDALEAKQNAEQYTATATAMRNVINGYGDEWLKPTYSLLDELAAELSYTEAGQKLKDARAHSSRMVKDRLAAECDYVEKNRKDTAVNFVVDAFNGKVDSILSKAKKDNYGKLEQQIRDAFSLVNYNGMAFRNARITESYLDARIAELHWATVAQELRSNEIEEQRLARERIREEEKARREYERAQKAAEKEAAMFRKAMEKAQAQLAQASEDQKAQYETQLADLAQKLKEAEDKGQKALSMAQQTKHGNVYVISNVGSFGENVYKVGMTRRLEPMDRVKELGDASVPFPFDVHAFIESDDAPALEHALHQDLALMQMNKVNPKKEFFKVTISDIRKLVENRGLDHVTWTMAAAAAEYKETLAIENRMKDDPSVQQQWVEFASSMSDDGEAAEDIV